MAVVAAHYGVSPAALRNDGTRRPGFVRRRHLAMWLARRLGASFPHIAYYMGFVDHTTIRHGAASVERQCADHAEFAALCAGLLDRARAITRKSQPYAGAGSGPDVSVVQPAE
jgi:chromosomal replication initiation ATPase DnaA